MKKRQKEVKMDPKKAKETSQELAIFTHQQRISIATSAHRTYSKVVVALSVSILLLLVIFTGVVVMLKPKNIYFATTSNGQIVPLTPLNQPLLSLQSVEAFTARAIGKTFTFDYANYKTQITENADQYTSSAFVGIKKALEAQGGLVSEAVKNNWVVTATITAAPQVVFQGRIGKTHLYGWQFVYPLLMTFQNEKTTNSSRYQAKVLVTRMDQKDYPSGIAIEKLILTQSGN